MKPTTIEGVLGKDLPPEWAKMANVDTNEEVSVIIQPANHLIRIAERIRQKAKDRGMTEEIFNRLMSSE